MVKGCRIDPGLCKKALSKKDSPNTLETRLSCETGIQGYRCMDKGQDSYIGIGL